MNTSFRSYPFQMKVLCIALLAAYPALAGASIAGRMQFVAGDVQILDAAGALRAAHKGDAVNEGETVQTATNSSAQLKLVDGGMVALRPGTQLKVVTYAFNGTDDGTESATFSLIKGGLRAITGLIGKKNKDKYRLNTPTATIGIRGTDHDAVVVLPPPPGMEATSPPGTYDKVNVGATSLTTSAGAAFIAPNQVGFAGAANQAPVILPTMPNIFQPTSAPQAKKQDKEEHKEKTQESTQKSDTKAKSSDTTATATDVAAAPTANLTATDADGNTLNLSQQSVTTATGESLAIDGNVAGKLAGGAQFLASYPQGGQDMPHPASYTSDGRGLTLTRDAAGNVSNAVFTTTDGSRGGSQGPKGGSDFHSTLSQVGSTLTDFGSDTATGLSWGRWHGGQVTQTRQYFDTDSSGASGLGAFDSNGNFVIGGTQVDTSSLGAGSLHWIAGNLAAPDYLPQILTGTASYRMVGGTQPTDLNGNAGALQSASVDVNFNMQTVKASLAFSISGNNWALKNDDMTLNGSRFATFYNCNAQCSNNVRITKNGVAVKNTPTPDTESAFGDLSGALMGKGLNAAALQYSVQESTPVTQVDSASGQTFTSFTHNLIQGIAALSGPTQDVATPFRIVALANETVDDFNRFFKDKSGVTFDSSAFPGLEGGEQALSRVIDSSSGLSEFIGHVRSFVPQQGTSVPSDTSNNGLAATIKVGTAVNRDVGSTVVNGTTISWGRWEGGSIDIYSRDGTVKLGTVDNANRSTHWLTSSVVNDGFFKLPLTGTASYTLAGNTSSTDMKGNVGKLGPVTLNADFAAAKVNASLDLSFSSPTNTSSWNMTANNIPLGSDGSFKSDTTLNGLNGIVHTATCTGISCGPDTAGQLNGHFISGGQGAAMIYGMMNGRLVAGASGSTFTPANIVSGLVVMRR